MICMMELMMETEKEKETANQQINAWSIISLEIETYTAVHVPLTGTRVESSNPRVENIN